MKILFFIPARKNSKGIKNKNLKKINKKPLISYTLNFIKKIISENKYNFSYFISSDSKKIIDYCKKNGFECEYKRPQNLALDKSLIIESVFDALKWLKTKKSINFDIIIVLQPTSPIRKIEEFYKALEIFIKNKYNSLVSITKMKEHPYECIKILKNKWVYIEKPAKRKKGRQEYENNYFYIDGSYYFVKVNFLNNKKSFIVEGLTKTFLLKREWPIDIDHNDDLKIAEIFL